MKQGKIWGETEEIFNDGKVSVHYLWIKEGGYCSEHLHVGKSNIFYVVTGSLGIIIWTKEKMEDMVILESGKSTYISPGVFHKFYGLTAVRCIEICESRLDSNDIERRTVGGLTNV